MLEPSLRRAQGLLLLVAVLLPGCIIPAPIEEEVPPEDLPPFVDQFTQVEPGLGVEVIDLTHGNPVSFGFFNVEDPNEDQVLYWRAVVDYGSTALADNVEQIQPHERQGSHTIQYEPCNPFHIGARLGSAGDDYLLIIGITDSPFLNPGNNFAGVRRLERAFEVEKGRRPPVFIVWGLELEGQCPL